MIIQTKRCDKMEKTISATEAVRDFSTLLNHIKFRGDRYIIKRSGKPVACMGSVEEAKTLKPLEELKYILEQLPRLENDLENFAEDLVRTAVEQPLPPEESPWV
jgi:antitoxin (DNA-binding transcriptional repressor) of toxin-antitoxin stability system